MIAERVIEKSLERLPVLEQALSTPGAASNQKTYRALLREHAALNRLREKFARYQALVREIAEHEEMAAEDEDSELAELAAAGLENLRADLPRVEKELMLSILPPDPNAERNAFVEIRAGTGGEEAGLFAGDLYRMYTRYAETRGWKLELMDAAPTEIGGFKELVFTLTGQGVFGCLQYESGVHRVQRVPVTESSGRIHTSAATVAVFPEVEAEDDLAIPPDEIRVDIFRSSGPGGQSVNTTDSAVRLTHLPTGITVQCQDEKSQHRNKEKAMRVLQARLLDRKRREEEEKMGKDRRSKIGSGDRSERIRTYNFPQNRLTDHRINLTLYSLDAIMEGQLDHLLQALQEHDTELRLQAQDPA